MPAPARTAFLRSLRDDEALALLYDWQFWARREQLAPPGDWFVWLIRSGRGFGKTRTGAEWVIERARQGFQRIALVGQTKADVRDTMVELGESSILHRSPPWFKPEYEPSKRRLTWPNGAVAMIYSGDEPGQLRGPQHDSAWVDELAKFRYPQETWDNLMLGLRIGGQPQALVTTTPRPIRLIRELIQRPTTVDVRRPTWDNLAHLSPVYIREVIDPMRGTRLGRQELEGEILEDAPGALWKRGQIEATRVDKGPDLVRVVVAVDPSATGKETSDEAGIVVAGLGRDGHGYVLDDRTLRASPHGWGSAAVQAYHRWQADRIVAETNNGGEMVELTIRTVDANVPYKGLHASRGKRTRAEPVAALYEQGRVHHVGAFPELEDEMCLAADTLVETINGPMKIQNVAPGEMVLTRMGYMPVLWSGMTHESAGVYEVRTKCRRFLLTTAGHPVYTAQDGFVKAICLRRGHTLEVLRWANTAPQLNGAGTSGLSTTEDTTWIGMASCFTEQFGKKHMGLSHMDLSSTTRMRIDSTTKSRILSCLPSLGIAESIPELVLPLSRTGSESGQVGSDGLIRRTMAEPVRTVVNTSNPVVYGQSSARPSAGSDSIESVTATGEKRPVYNLKVFGMNEYFANGVLVHNCQWEPGDDSPNRMDALVWALTELMLGEVEVRPLPSVAFVGVKRGREAT